MVQIYDRRKGVLTNHEDYQSQKLQVIYSPILARILLPIVKSSLFSILWTLPDYLPGSKAKIGRFIKDYQLNPEDFKEKSFKHFAAFFERSYLASSRPVCPPDCLMAVSDGKLQVYAIDQDLSFKIKERIYLLKDLFTHQLDWSIYQGGYVFVYRLSMEDGHRYLFAESGLIEKNVTLPGSLHTIRQMGHNHCPVFIENHRQYIVINNIEMGPIIQMEVGAMTVGKIMNHPLRQAQRGQEKGYFKLGGSSIIVLYPAGSYKVDEDILKWSKKGFETKVLMGERIGVKHA